MKNIRLFGEILEVIQATTAQLGFIVEALECGHSLTGEELVTALNDIYSRNYAAAEAIKELKED